MQRRVPEAEFPTTFHPQRSLEIIYTASKSSYDDQMAPIGAPTEGLLMKDSSFIPMDTSTASRSNSPIHRHEPIKTDDTPPTQIPGEEGEETKMDTNLEKYLQAVTKFINVSKSTDVSNPSTDSLNHHQQHPYSFNLLGSPNQKTVPATLFKVNRFLFLYSLHAILTVV